MPKKPAIPGGAAAPLASGDELDEFKTLLGDILSPDKPRPVVTPRGRPRVTGNLPLLKAVGDARFDSGLERSCLLLLSMAPRTRWIATHPVVLSLRDAGGRAWTYTPDAVVRVVEAKEERPAYVICEFRGERWLRTPEARDRVVANARHLRLRGHMFLIVVDRDLCPRLLAEVNLLLRSRPLAHRWRVDLDRDAWDPSHRTQPDAETARRWASAQQQCDALLRRVMDRDSDQLMAELAV